VVSGCVFLEPIRKLPKSSETSEVWKVFGWVLIRAKLKEKLPDIGFDIGQAGWNIESDLWFLTRLDVLPRLLADFSFKELPDDFWNRLQHSRNVRNQVVHEGGDVEEYDAANTLVVTTL